MSINAFSDIDWCYDDIISSYYYLTQIDDVQFRPAFIAVDNAEDAKIKENVIYIHNISNLLRFMIYRVMQRCYKHV